MSGKQYTEDFKQEALKLRTPVSRLVSLLFCGTRFNT